jgi:hypothetical protein
VARALGSSPLIAAEYLEMTPVARLLLTEDSALSSPNDASMSDDFSALLQRHPSYLTAAPLVQYLASAAQHSFDFPALASEPIPGGWNDWFDESGVLHPDSSV